MRTPPTNEDDFAEEATTAELDRPAKSDLVEAVREKLCDADAAVRIHAALELGEIGTLDDIGLLSDVLSLPCSEDEHPKERAAILHAMKRLSRIDEGSFDLCEVPKMPKSFAKFISENLTEDGTKARTTGITCYHRELLMLLAVVLVMAIVFFILL
jgi:hypothetical protein